MIHPRGKLSRPPRGFSLAELSVAIGMFSLIATALGSAVMLASRSIPDAKSPGANQMAASRVADQIAAELAYALSVTEMTSTAVTFTVADRDGGGSGETIRYAWSGVAGDPLTRQYNSNAATTVLCNVQELAFAFDKKKTKLPATYTESAETLLYSFSGALLSGNYDIQNNNWCAQYFVPTLPGNISSWRITHVRFKALSGGPKNGETRVQIRPVNSSNQPSNVVLDQSALLESSLGGSATWQDAYFTRASGLSPSSGACVVFRWVSDAEACNIQYYTLAISLSGAAAMTTTNSGSTWSTSLLTSIPLYVYGTSSTQNADSYQYNLQSVRMLLRSGGDLASRVNVGSLVMSQPTVGGP